MKKVRCPKCNSYIVFDETRYQPGQRLVFVCSECKKQFAIKAPLQTSPRGGRLSDAELPSSSVLSKANPIIAEI